MTRTCRHWSHASRASAFHRGFVLLALLAVALLNAVPTVSRLQQAFGSASAPASLPVSAPTLSSSATAHALCTALGLQQVALPLLAHLADHARDGDSALPHAPSHRGD